MQGQCHHAHVGFFHDVNGNNGSVFQRLQERANGVGTRTDDLDRQRRNIGGSNAGIRLLSDPVTQV